MSRLFTQGDEAVEAGANQSFLLDAGGVWFVERGRIDVFCVRLAAGGTVADRTHIARVPAGQCLFGDGGGDVGEGDSAEGVEYSNDSGTTPSVVCEATAREGAADSQAVQGVLQAVGSAGTTLRFLGEGAARTRFEEAALRVEGARLIDAWVDAIFAGLIVGAMPRDCEALQPPSFARLAPAAAASSRSGVAWIGHVDGRSSLLGKSELLMRGRPIPCSTRAWFVASVASDVRVMTTLSLLEQGDVWTSLGAFQRLATRGSLSAMDERSASERLRQRRRRVEREALMRDAFVELVAAHDATTDPRGDAGAHRGDRGRGRAGYAPSRLWRGGRCTRAVAGAGTEARRGSIGRSRSGHRQGGGRPGAPGTPGGLLVAERQWTIARSHGAG